MKQWVCVVCEHETDDWSVATQHYYHTGHGFESRERRQVHSPESPHTESTMQKRFGRISWNEKKIALEWTVTNETETHAHELTCADVPRPAFNEALQALRPDVLVICELDDEYGETMRVQSVSLTTNAKSGARGAVVTAMKGLELANGPLSLHTPHLLAESASDNEKGEGETSGVMPKGMWPRIEALEAEAWAYLDGKRAPKPQTELPLAGVKEAELAGAGA